MWMKRQDRIMFALPMVVPLDGIEDLLQVPKSEENEQIATAGTKTTSGERLHESPWKDMHEGNIEQCPTTGCVTTRSGRVVKKPKRSGDYEQ